MQLSTGAVLVTEVANVELQRKREDDVRELVFEFREATGYLDVLPDGTPTDLFVELQHQQSDGTLDEEEATRVLHASRRSPPSDDALKQRELVLTRAAWAASGRHVGLFDEPPLITVAERPEVEFRLDRLSDAAKAVGATVRNSKDSRAVQPLYSKIGKRVGRVLDYHRLKTSELGRRFVPENGREANVWKWYEEVLLDVRDLFLFVQQTFRSHFFVMPAPTSSALKGPLGPGAAATARFAKKSASKASSSSSSKSGARKSGKKKDEDGEEASKVGDAAGKFKSPRRKKKSAVSSSPSKGGGDGSPATPGHSPCANASTSKRCKSQGSSKCSFSLCFQCCVSTPGACSHHQQKSARRSTQKRQQQVQSPSGTTPASTPRSDGSKQQLQQPPPQPRFGSPSAESPSDASKSKRLQESSPPVTRNGKKQKTRNADPASAAAGGRQVTVTVNKKKKQKQKSGGGGGGGASQGAGGQKASHSK